MTTRNEGPHGLLLVDKPDGPTSHDVVGWVRRALRTRRVGHAGTLDPFATGLLACCVGNATRLVRWLSGSEKTYEGVIRFGWETDSGDRTGRRLEPEGASPAPDVARLSALASSSLTGEILQVPPMHSAKKRDGVALYVLARRGEEVEREAVRVRASGWRFEPGASEGLVGFEVTCSAGTYVRELARSLGRLASCPAHLQELRRTASGELSVVGALPAGSLEPASALAALIPLSRVPLPLPCAVIAGESTLASFRQGRRVPPLEIAGVEGEEVAVRWESPDGELLGVARRSGDGLAPTVVLPDSDAQTMG